MNDTVLTTWQQARISRDPRFDGTFFVAVKSTGIFCRPICPAPLPLEKNVVYYRTRTEAGEINLEARHPGLRWYSINSREILTRRPAQESTEAKEGLVLPVLMLTGDERSITEDSTNDVCPSCGAKDSIRFLGSAVATLGPSESLPLHPVRTRANARPATTRRGSEVMGTSIRVRGASRAPPRRDTVAGGSHLAVRYH